MKKIITFLFLITLFIGCTEATIENSVENPKQFTTVELQELPKDTVIIANDGQLMYVFDKETNLVKYQANVVNEDTLAIPIGWLIFIGILFFAAGFSSNYI